jgi:hypothetical protein
VHRVLYQVQNPATFRVPFQIPFQVILGPRLKPSFDPTDVPSSVPVRSQVFGILIERGADISTEKRTNHLNVDPNLEPSIQDLHQVLTQACSIFEPSLILHRYLPQSHPSFFPNLEK